MYVCIMYVCLYIYLYITPHEVRINNIITSEKCGFSQRFILVTERSKVLIEKFIVVQSVNKFSSFETRSLSTMFTRAPLLGHILCQMTPIHTVTPLTTHSQIILTSLPRFSKWSLPYRFAESFYLNKYHMSGQFKRQGFVLMLHLYERLFSSEANTANSLY
jgi:hypothetical protein